VGMPLGILKSAAMLTVTRGTSSHIEYADLVNMFASFFMGSLSRAMWIANQTTIKDLMSIVDHSGNRVFLPNSGITQATAPSILDRTTSNGMRYSAAGTLLGLPIRFTEKLPPLGTSGDLILIDPTQYGVATRQNLEIGVSEHFKFNQDLISYRFKIRNDGRPMWLAPYQSADSANTKYSPFVKIA
jgi:HK97 family phage major capsid protein